jgi:UDP-N-acetylglucosamine--N-acetylmuramyl-(pentapeptide) pyrophosphoryl-undecaprenol N-acetylglucosamine transferase
MPALSIAGALRSRHPDWMVVLVGSLRGLEATRLPQLDFHYQLLPFEPIYRGRQAWKNYRWPALAIRLIRAVNQVLDAEQPDLVLGTGGYVAGPVVWLAGRRGIKTAILEQDAYPGLVTRMLANRVREVYLGAPEAARHLRTSWRTAVVPTGSPITPPDPARRSAARQRFQLPEGRPVVLIMGGSQGALAINEAVAGWIEDGGSRGLTVLWGTGERSFDRFRQLANPPAIQIFDFLEPVGDGYAVADLVVCRAGMMTLSEVTAWGLPSVIIPLPSAAGDHQTKNARAMAAAGAAVLLRQADLTPESLRGTIASLLGDQPRLARMRAQSAFRGRPTALNDIVARLEELVAL